MSPERDVVAIGIEKSLSALSSTTQSKPTIFKVDDRLREVNVKDYEPKIVSIGPIHHSDSHISGMERHKLRLLQELLEERKHLTIDKLVEELRKKEGDARKCYPQSLNNLDEDKFLRMLLLDGCFIIQLTLKYFSGKSKNPVFESEKLIQIIHDLLLFENQLPFAVLDCLFNLIKTGNPDDNLPDLILFLVAGIVPWLDVSKLDSKFIPDHLLGLVYKCISTKIPPKLNSPWYTLLYPKHLVGLIYRLIFIIIHLITRVIKLIVKLIILLYQGKGKKKSRAKEKKSPLIHINSASELKEVMGIELKMSEDDSITFAGKVLKFPPLEVSVETESLLRNLMAYEQLQLDDNHQKHVIDYMFFLHCLTRSIKDIEILRYSGIIRNYLGGDQKILEMFDRLGANFLRSSVFTYSDVFERLNRHCANRRNEWTASLRQNYFNSPWSLLSFLAAVLLLLISITQITLAILTYFHKKTVYVVGEPPRT